MSFKQITGRLGNMRKDVEWVIYPRQGVKVAGTWAPSDVVIIQSDRRIAAVNLETGATVLSDGKGGHQGFLKLQTALGGAQCECPEYMLNQLRRAVSA